MGPPGPPGTPGTPGTPGAGGGASQTNYNTQELAEYVIRIINGEAQLNALLETETPALPTEAVSPSKNIQIGSD